MTLPLRVAASAPILIKFTILKKDGKPEDLPLMSKRAVADKILDNVSKLLKVKK